MIMDMIQLIRRRLDSYLIIDQADWLILSRDSRYGRYYDSYYDDRAAQPLPPPPPPSARDDRQYSNHYYESTPHYAGVEPSTYATKDDYYDYYYQRADSAYDPYPHRQSSSHSSSAAASYYDYNYPADGSSYYNSYYDTASYDYASHHPYSQDPYKSVSPPPLPAATSRPTYDYSPTKSYDSSQDKVRTNRNSKSLSMFGTVLSSRVRSANNTSNVMKVIKSPSPMTDVIMASPTSSLQSMSRDRSPVQREKVKEPVKMGEGHQPAGKLLSPLPKSPESKKIVEPVKRDIKGKAVTSTCHQVSHGCCRRLNGPTFTALT
jgi:hypothetical protein